jgi:AcrR family transcriptional regulator
MLVPKIDAPTVAEHRARVQARLVDAAEAILRASPPQRLTAGAVTSAAGIARNSIYRYVDSVDDLRTMVVDRYLPAWLDALDLAMRAAEKPPDRVVAWVGANLEQAAASGHGWLMGAARDRTAESAVDEVVDRAHRGARDSLVTAWRDVLAAGGPDPQGAETDRVLVAVALTVGLVDAAFRQIDLGRDPVLVQTMAVEAARALVSGFTASGAPTP